MMNSYQPAHQQIVTNNFVRVGVGLWNQSLHSFLKISDSLERTVPQISLQDAFMYFGAVVLVMNIIVRYIFIL